MGQFGISSKEDFAIGCRARVGGQNGLSDFGLDVILLSEDDACGGIKVLARRQFKL